MASPIPSNAPVPGQIELTARKLSVVTVRGVSYEFSITGSISDKRCDELVKNHIEFLLTASKRDSFDAIKSVMKKTDPTSTSDALHPPFIIESSEVKYLSKKGKVKSKDALATYIRPLQENPNSYSHETHEKVKRFWDATQNSLVELTSGAANPAETPANIIPPGLDPANAPQPPALDPANPAPAPANPPIVERPRTVITPYVSRAKRMPNPTGTPKQFPVVVALATQLSVMPNASNGTSKYNGIDTGAIAADLRKKYVNYISDHQDDYLTKPKFSEILDNLKNALLKDKPNLEMACDNLHSPNWTWFGYTDTNMRQLEELLLNSIDTLSLNQKCDLFKIHNEYVKNGVYVNENSFLDTFVKIHDSDSSPDKFEVVVINPNNTDAPKTHLCSRNPFRSTTKLPISESSCAFLCVDDQGRYQSIPRKTGQFPLGETLTGAAIVDDLTENRDVSNELGLLIDLYDSYENQSLKDYILRGANPGDLLGGFANNYPQAFDRLKHFIYRHDRDTNNVNASVENGFDNLDYGFEALKAMDADALATFLTKNRANILAVGRNKDAVI